MNDWCRGYKKVFYLIFYSIIALVQLLSHVRLLVIPWTATHQASLFFTISWSPLMSIESVIPSYHLILCHPFLLLPLIFPRIGIFSNKLALHIRWPKYWRNSFSISPSNEYSGLFSFRIDWFDLLAVQETFKSLLQHHTSKASILQRSAFLKLQLSHPYMTTGKIIALTIWTFARKVMSLLFNMLPRWVIGFLPRSKCLLISWLQSPSTVIFGAQANKVCQCFHFFHIYLAWSDGTRCHDIRFLMLSFKLVFFSLSSFTIIKMFFNSSSLSAIRAVSPAYLRLLTFLPATLIPVWDSSTLAFHMMCSAYVK